MFLHGYARMKAAALPGMSDRDPVLVSEDQGAFALLRCGGVALGLVSTISACEGVQKEISVCVCVH